MTDAVQAALIVSVAPTIASIAAFIVSVKNHGKITEVRHEFNDRMTQFMRAKDELADARVSAAEAQGRSDVRDATDTAQADAKSQLPR